MDLMPPQVAAFSISQEPTKAPPLARAQILSPSRLTAGSDCPRSALSTHLTLGAEGEFTVYA